jgi:uncharacterized spore protein YtfJ
MNIQEVLARGQDAVTVARVFGPPIEKDGVVLVPAAFVTGGGGGGGNDDPNAENSGSGGGFGTASWPVGAYVIRGGDVRWEPAVNLNFVIGLGVLAFLALLRTRRTVVRARSKARSS